MKKLHFIKPKLVKSKFFLGIPLALFSLEAYSGALFGYFLAKFFSGKETGFPGKIKSLAFNIGKWKIHIHHWLYGLGVLISLFFINLPLSQFSFGILGGVIFQGIFCYSDWSKIIIKQKKAKI